MHHMIDDIEIYQDWKPDEPATPKAATRDVLDVVTDHKKVGLSIDPKAKTIHINGEKLVNCQAVYNRLRELWSNNSMGLMSYSNPMNAITWVLFIMEDGWKITNPEMLAFELPAQPERGLRDNEP